MRVQHKRGTSVWHKVMPPSRCRVIIECAVTAIGCLIGYGFFLLGIATNNYHTIIWGWFSGFCALRVYAMQITYLRKEFHDKFDAEQLTRIKIITAYLLLGSIVSCAYYLPFAVIYNESFSLLNPVNSVEVNYWPSLISSLSSIIWLSLLLANVITYRNYLLTENIPNISGDRMRRNQESRPLLA